MRIVTKSPKVGPLLIFFISLPYTHQNGIGLVGVPGREGGVHSQADAVAHDGEQDEELERFPLHQSDTVLPVLHYSQSMERLLHNAGFRIRITLMRIRIQIPRFSLTWIRIRSDADPQPGSGSLVSL